MGMGPYARAAERFNAVMAPLTASHSERNFEGGRFNESTS